jgi:tetratricopeptide (TPR) repeat protein
MTPRTPDPRSSTSDVLLALEQRFAQRRTAAQPGPSVRTPNPYLLAAAVLHVFDPRTLQPYGDEPPNDEPTPGLLGQSVPAVGWRHRRLRTLKPEVRRAALEQLGSRQAMRRALEANPGRTPTTLQTLYEQWLDGETLEPERLSYPHLESLRELYGWGLDRFGPLPDRVRLEAARVRRAAVAAFEHLVDKNFVGREAELQDLRDYVGVVSPSVWARLRSFLDHGPVPPLVIWGAGGTGKTALIGRFLMEHVESAAAGWFPFAYLAFDSHTLDIREPFTLVVAAASQLSAQVSPSGMDGGEKGGHASREGILAAFDEFRRAVESYRDQRGVLQHRANQALTQQARVSELSDTETALYTGFGELLATVSRAAGMQQKAAPVPVLLVLDTFEEVLYRTDEELTGVWSMLEAVQAAFPALRVVISGRVRPRPFEVGGREPSMLELRDLKERDATILLGRLGINDPQAARAIVRQIGGSPLTLRLAARVAREEAVGARGIERLRTRKYWVVDLAPELIRGQLYRRILDHIHDEDIRALAHPGMVLRRVTPELISDVLAPVCGLKDVDDARARDLFESLRREHTLVSGEGDEALRYREEVRRPVLALLRRDKPEQVRLIHERAERYYRHRDRSDPVERTEELYHHLMLGEDTDAGQLARRWLPGLDGPMGSVIEEIPLEQRIYLAEQMSIQLPEEVYRQANLAGWERLIGRKALDALRHEGSKRAFSLLRERRERTPESALYAIEARVLMALGRPEEAAALLDRAIDGYPAVGNPGRLAELLWMRAQAALVVEEPAEAVDVLRRLAGMAPQLDSALPRVQALTQLVEVELRQGAASVEETRTSLAGALQKLSEAEVDMERSLVRLALTRLGPEYPATLWRLLPLVVQDWRLVVERRKSNVDRALKLAELTLRQGGEERLAAYAGEAHTAAAAMDLMQMLIRRTQVSGEQRPEWAATVFQFLRVEDATLRGSTLAGLESYREPWELAAAREVVA